jgi:hypothetical protein
MRISGVFHSPEGRTVSSPAFPRGASMTLSAAVLALSGCYVMPVGSGPDGTPHYVYSTWPVTPSSPRKTNGFPAAKRG